MDAREANLRIWALVLVSRDADLSGDTAVIGSGELGGPGSVQVFERNMGGPNAWGQSAFVVPFS